MEMIQAGRYPDASIFMQPATQLSSQLFGPAHNFTSTLVMKHIEIENNIARYQASRSLAGSYLEESEKKYGVDSIQVVLPLLLMSSASEKEEGLQRCDRALSIAEKHQNKQKILEVMMGKATCYSRAGDHNEAVLWYTKVIHEEKGEAKILHIAALHNLGVNHMKNKNYEEAQQLFTRGISLIVEEAEETQRLHGELLLGLSESLVEQKKVEEAMKTIEKALPLIETTSGKQSILMAEALHIAGRLKSPLWAEGLYQRAIDILDTKNVLLVKHLMLPLLQDMEKIKKSKGSVNEAKRIQERIVSLQDDTKEITHV